MPGSMVTSKHMMKLWHLALIASGTFFSLVASQSSSDPTVTVSNGTYSGLYQPTYAQDLFLGIPFAQSPVGDLRLALPQPLNTTWNGTHNATAYYPECVGYGGDDVGYETSEDCLALNVIRPTGYANQSLPVAVWIHGGGYIMGGTPDRRYNLSFIVQNSVALGKPIIAVSIAYRLSGWGFLDSQEIRDAGVTNLGMRDQRLALSWIQENIEAFGGNPQNVTIWGESAGAGSVGIHLIAYGGRDDKLFSGAIGESGSPILLGPKYNVSDGQKIYDNITQTIGCSNASDTLQCIRSTSFETLNNALNTSKALSFFPYVDGDFINGSIYDQLQNGQFVKVPYLIGTNADEGSAFGPQGINNDTAFEAYLNSTGADYQSVQTLEVLYPNIPAVGTIEAVPLVANTTYGTQFKRVAAFAGDFSFIAARRLTCEQWSAFDTSAYCYRFNVTVNPLPAIIGATHFQEVAFVFNNVQGLGYAVNPFEGEPPTYYLLSKLMSNMWVSFIHDGDPNNHGQVGIEQWPVYNATGGYGEDFFFSTNVTSHPEPDNYRAAAMAYLNSLWPTQYDK